MILELLSAIETEEEYDAIDGIFRLYYPKMVGIANKILHNQADAEDAVMTALRYMCDEPKHFLNYRTPKTCALICQKVSWCALDIYRQNKKNSENTVSLSEESEVFIQEVNTEDLSDLLINVHNREMMHKALNELDPDLRIPILLRYYYQMSSREIARFMDLNENLIDVRIHRAKEHLRKICVSMGYES